MAPPSSALKWICDLSRLRAFFFQHFFSCKFNCIPLSLALHPNMHYKSRPPFKTKHWRQLYEFHTSDIKPLKECAKGAAFVVIDAEPWGRDNSQLAEIGLSLLPPTHVNLELSNTLDEASNDRIRNTLDTLRRQRKARKGS